MGLRFVSVPAEPADRHRLVAQSAETIPSDYQDHALSASSSADDKTPLQIMLTGLPISSLSSPNPATWVARAIRAAAVIDTQRTTIQTFTRTSDAKRAGCGQAPGLSLLPAVRQILIRLTSGRHSRSSRWTRCRSESHTEAATYVAFARPQFSRVRKDSARPSTRSESAAGCRSDAGRLCAAS